MKKLIFGVLGLVAFSAAAQNYTRVSFLADEIYSITVSNKLGGLTNANLPFNGATNSVLDGQYGGATNQPNNVLYVKAGSGGQTYPPSQGSATTLAATNKWGTANLFQDVDLWVDREARFPAATYYSNATDVLQSPWQPSHLTISVYSTVTNTTVCAFNIRFAPVWDGIHVSTNALDVWTVGFTTGGAANYLNMQSTNVPYALRFAGAKSLRILDITSTTASAGAIATIRGIYLHGFKP